MKKIRLFFFASIVICFAAALAACGKQTLSQPGGLTIDETTLDLTWNEVEDARRYVISINGKETEIRQNLYDLEYLEPGNYEIKIKAVNERTALRIQNGLKQSTLRERPSRDFFIA